MVGHGFLKIRTKNIRQATSGLSGIKLALEQESLKKSLVNISLVHSLPQWARWSTRLTIISMRSNTGPEYRTDFNGREKI